MAPPPQLYPAMNHDAPSCVSLDMSEPLQWSIPAPLSTTLAGLGCGLSLLVLSLVGAIAAISAGEWTSLAGMPIALLFALAFLVVGVRRDQVTLTPEVLTRRSTLLGIPVRTRRIPLQSPTGVGLERTELRGLLRRSTLHTLYILDAVPVPVEMFAAEADCQARGERIAALLSVPFVAQPQEGLAERVLAARQTL
jgi:hypothetical protein